MKLGPKLVTEFGIYFYGGLPKYKEMKVPNSIVQHSKYLSIIDTLYSPCILSQLAVL